MADPRFFAVKGPFSVGELCSVAGATLHDGGDPALTICDVAPLVSAGPDEISFLENPRYLDVFRKSRAGACIVAANRVDDAPDRMTLLVSKNPYRSYALIAQAFYPEEDVSEYVASSAVVDPSAVIGKDTWISAGAVIGARVEIGRRCHIGANSVVSDGVIIGDDTRIGSCASLSHCIVGDRVRLFSGVRIGEAGFGFSSRTQGDV